MLFSIANSFGSSVDPPFGSVPPDNPLGDVSGNFIQVIVTLVVMIGLIVLLIRFLAARTKRWSGDRTLRVHAGVALGQHKSLQIVEIGDAVYIVGVGEDVTLLDKIEDAQQVEALLASLEARYAAGSGAAELWSGWLSRLRKGSKPEHSEQQANEAFRQLLSEKLRNVNSRKQTMKAWIEDESPPGRTDRTP